MKPKKRTTPEGVPTRPQSVTGSHPYVDDVTTRRISVTTNTTGMSKAPSKEEAFDMGHKSAVENRVSARDHGGRNGDSSNMDPLNTDRDFINRRRK